MKASGTLLRARLLGVVLLSNTLAFSAIAAEVPRLSLTITQPFQDADGSECLSDTADSAPVLAITEHDVAHWNPIGARWTLDPDHSTAVSGERLADRCFALAIDGRIVERGLALSVNTPTLTGYPTLNLIPENGRLTLQITSGNHGSIHVLHAPLLEEVFGTRGNRARQ